MRALVLAFALCFAPSTDVETWARALVGTTDPTVTQRDAAQRWLELVAAEPSHPLVEATLRLIAADEGLLASTPALGDRILGLSSAGMSFRAKGELARLQGSVRAVRAPLEGTPVDAYPGWLARFSVLGPLGPFDDLDAARHEEARLSEPGFDREHDGPLGAKLRWLDRARAPLDASTPRLDAVLGAREGHSLIAFRFDAERAAPAWLELDARDGKGAFVFDVASTQDRPWTYSIVDPSFDWKFNGAESGRVDFRAAPRSALELAPVRVARGANVLVLSVETASEATFAVRLLDVDGEPLAGLVQPSRADARNYDDVRAPTGADARATDSVALVDALGAHGPCTDAVLGIALVLDGRAALGLARAEAAYAAAPDDATIASLLGTVVRDAPHLPDAWRRNRARELYTKSIELDPQSYRAGLELARRLATEDKDEDALAKLNALGAAAPAREEAWFELERIYAKLGLAVHAERAVDHLFEAPTPSYASYGRAAEHLDGAGRATSAYLALVRGVKANGANQPRLAELAGRAQSLGLVAEAEAWQRLRIARAGNAQPMLELADLLVDLERLDEAERVLADAAALLPFSAAPWTKRAELAHRRRDDSAERAALEHVLALEPSNRAARRGLAALAAGSPLGPIAAREQEIAARSARIYASYDPARWNESVVRVLDWSGTTVFADGGFEALVHTILHVRDLAACEAQGTQRFGGEVLKVVTHKSDGREIEPIESNGEYVMPSLEPGDFIETVTLESGAPSADGGVHLPRWSFASVDEPFHVSHYEVVAPRTLEPVIARRHFGELAAVDEGVESSSDGTRRWTFESHDAARVALEPGAPSPEHFLPNVEFGVAPNRERLAASLAALASVSTRVTPPLEAAARGAIAGVVGENAQAKTLFAWVAKNLDKRNPRTFASATVALLTREGNPVWLYSALLDAVGIEHEVVFSRDVAPDADLDANEEFYDESRWLGRMLVVVRPKDGPEAWCDPSSQTLPYGTLLGNAPRAECFATRSKRFLLTPALPLIERVGQTLELVARVAADRSAEVEMRLGFSGNAGFAQKEGLRDLPDAQRKRVAAQIGSGIAPGFDLASFEFEGLDSADAPLTIVVKGKVKRFLDETGGDLAARFPLPPLHLGTQLTGGEGARRLPYHLDNAIVLRGEARIELPEGFELDGDGPSSNLEFESGTYTLTTEREGTARVWIVRRQLALPSFLIAKELYADWQTFVTAVDEVERPKLRLRR